jgi:hypothetical protein
LILVRLLLFLSLAAIGAALLLWLVKRDRRYLRFIGLTLKFTLLVLLAILLWFAAERVLAPVLAPLLLYLTFWWPRRAPNLSALRVRARGLA